MQDASAEFATAIGKGEVVWTKPQLLADWLDDGAAALSAAPTFVVDRFNDRQTDDTWLRPAGHRSDYVHFDGVGTDYTIEPEGYATHLHNPVGGKRRSLIPASTSFMTVFAIWSMSTTLTGTGNSMFEIIAGDEGDGLTNQYALRLQIDAADDTMDVILLKIDAGVVSLVDIDLDVLTHQADHEYTMMLQVADGTVRGKVWDSSVSIEPTTWTLEAVDSVAGLGLYGGVRSEIAATVTNTPPVIVKWHELRVVDGSIDDLSDLAGQIVITQDMDDGLPQQVSYVQDLGSVAFDAQLVHGRRGMDAIQYLSQHNPDSPLYNLARDVAPITFDHGAITSAGPERLRLFTGQMMDVSLGQDQIGHLTAMSSTRLKLSQLVQPPPFVRYGDLTASWPVSWAAYTCGVYAAPPPRTECILYAPMHGSMIPFLSQDMLLGSVGQVSGDNTDVGFTIWEDDGDRVTGSALTWNYLLRRETAESQIPAYTDGPYVAAPSLQFTTERAVGMAYRALPLDITSELGMELLTPDVPRGRLEFAVRGDDFDTTAPSGTDYTPTNFILGLFLANSTDSGQRIYAGISMARRLRVEISDGTFEVSINFSAPSFDLPTDGEWHRYGVAWDFLAEKVYVYRRDSDGNEFETDTTIVDLDVTRLTTGDWPFGELIPTPFNQADVGEGGIFSPYFHSFLPFAEVHVSQNVGGPTAAAPWIWSDDYEWDRSTIMPSATRLRAIAEPAPREAWEYIGSFAQAEKAALRIDESDLLQFLTPAYFALQAQQAAGQTLSTATNVATLVPQVDPSKIRNSISVQYQETVIDSSFQPVLNTHDTIALLPGTTQLLITLDVPTAELYGSSTLGVLYTEQPTEAQINAGLTSFLGGAWRTFMTINSASDGTGTYYSHTPGDIPQFVYSLIDPGFTPNTILVTFFNDTLQTVYITNDNNEFPTILIAGLGVHQVAAAVEVVRDSSIARRGYRGLAVDSPIHQRREDAQRLAQRLLNELAEPTPTLERVRLFGDPRRQPGDLVTFQDRRSAVSGSWRLLSVQHVIDGANYYQDVRLRQALPIGEWQETGTSRWGQVLWGREGL